MLLLISENNKIHSPIKRTKAIWGKWLSPCLRQEKNKVSFDILLFSESMGTLKNKWHCVKRFQELAQGLPLAKFRTTRASKIIMTIINDNMLNDCDRREKREKREKGRRYAG